MCVYVYWYVCICILVCVYMYTVFLFQKLRGTTEALYVLTKCNNTRFEFIFTNLVSYNLPIT